MQRKLFILGAVAWAAWMMGPLLRPTSAQSEGEIDAPASVLHGAETIDGIAARVNDDILTESELRELGAFQTLVDGKPKTRDELIRELSDQWIVRGEASATKYPQPSTEEIANAYAQLVKQFPSLDVFKSRCAEVGLTDTAVRRLLGEQLYLSRFLDFRFRPAAQVDDQQVAAYYQNEFEPQLVKRGDKVPSLEEVQDTIREVLVQRAIDQRATAWLDDTRKELRIDVVPEGDPEEAQR